MDKVVSMFSISPQSSPATSPTRCVVNSRRVGPTRLPLLLENLSSAHMLEGVCVFLCMLVSHWPKRNAHGTSLDPLSCVSGVEVRNTRRMVTESAVNAEDKLVYL